MTRPRKYSVLGALLSLALTCVDSVGAFADGRDVAKLLVERVAPATVPVRVVMSAKISFEGHSMDVPEQEMTIPGTIVDSSGLIMTGTEAQAVRAFEASRPGLKVAISVRSVHVQVPGEAIERDAVLVVKDVTLGLAFVQIVGALETQFPAIDLAAGTTAQVGANVYGVHRLSRGFDYAPEVLRGFVCGMFEQPRHMGMLSGDFNEFGLPVYDAEGRAAGVFAMQIGTEGLASLESPMESMTGAILPLEVVRASLAQAKKRVPEALEKAKAGEGEKPATTPTKPPTPIDGAQPAPAPAPEPAPIPAPK